MNGNFTDNNMNSITNVQQFYENLYQNYPPQEQQKPQIPVQEEKNTIQNVSIYDMYNLYYMYNYMVYSNLLMNINADKLKMK